MPIPTSVTFYPGNNQFVEIQGMKDAAAGTPLDSETVTANLYDPAGVVVPGFSALPMTYEASSTGNYKCQIVGASFNPPLGSGYSLQITSTNGFLLTIKAKIATRKS